MKRLVLLLVYALFLFGQAQVISVNPLQNEIDVLFNTDIQVIFDVEMDSASINDTTFLAIGNMSGLHLGNINYVSATNRATLNPNSDFITGELVLVILTSGIMDSTGMPIEGYTWSFTATATNGIGIFQAPLISSTNNGPLGICAAYMDTDNNLDLVVANHLSQDISVLFGNGDGTFADPVHYTTGPEPYAIACGDIDQDGDNDCIVACAGADSIYSFINDGAGGLSPAGQFATGSYPTTIVVSDFNQDGFLDVSTVNRSGNTVSVLLGNGDGTFLTATNYPAGNGPAGLTAGDFDGDGDIDLASGVRNSNKARVYYNSGDGLFILGGQFATGSRPNSIFAAVLDSNDLHLDLCTPNQNAHTATVLLGDGDTLFIPAGDFPASLAPAHLVCADIDADADLDMLVSNSGDDSISVLFNDGNADFSTLVNFYGGDSVIRLCSGDFNNDGSIDIGVACYNADSVSVLLNYGDDTPPGPPQNLVANGANPSPWANYNVFEIDWTNPPDTSGIKRALYKLDTAPVSNFDTTGTMSGTPPDSAAATSEAGQMLYVWLEDNAGNLDFNNFAQVELRYDGTEPSGSEASSPLYSANEDFTVSWTAGSDTGGSGLSGNYDIQVKDGSGPWTPWLTNYSGFSSLYSGTDGHVYYFEAGARDNAGNIEVFIGFPECFTYVDTTSPFVFATVPSDGDTGITPNTNITARFSELMDSTTMIITNFLIQGSQSGNHSFAVSYSAVDSSVYLDPDVNFAFSETVTVTVQSDVADLAGNMMTSDEVWSFSIGASFDTLGPITSSVNASPNPTEPIANVTMTAFVTDAGQGDNNINAAEFFIDIPGANGTGYSMAPVDSFWDEISEDVIASLNTQPLNWIVNDTHLIYIHGLDAPGNWGDFDSVVVIVAPDDDTLGPIFSSFDPIQWPDTSGFYIECQITDPSGVFDDSTGSQGQGVYLLWDNDGEIVVDAYEVTMFNTIGLYYQTDSLIPTQEAGVNFVYETYAYDDDFDTQHPDDRTQDSSGVQSIVILDLRGPGCSNALASPNPTAGATELSLTGIISDSLFGNSVIYTAEYFIDVPGSDSTGIMMQAIDGAFDEIVEDIIDTLDISSWQYGTPRWLFIHGLDVSGNWGTFDSVLVYVTAADDTIPPFIVATSPDSGETDVTLNRNIFITFSEPMDTTSLDTSKFHISGSINPTYTYVLTYDTTLDYSVKLDPDSLFAVNETITVDVSQAVTDTAGNGMLEPYSFFFVTSSTVDTIGPIVETANAYPDTTEGAHYCNISAVISDSTTGMSPIRGAEIFVDSIGSNGTGQSMIPTDSIWDEIVEDVQRQLDISLLSLGVHWFYLHGRDDAANWGDIDSLLIIVTEDDDTLGPAFSAFSPDSVPDTCGFYIYCAITDPSGIYDDSTGSNGQGVYLLWDDDGELIIDSYEAQMSLLSGDTFRIDIEIQQQTNDVNFVYEIFAYDNDFDFNELQDRTQAQSGMQNIIVYDGLGPYTSYTQVSPPNPPEGINEVVVYATVSDSLTGLSVITGSEAFLDSIGTNGTGFAMGAIDGFFDEIEEDVFDTIPVSGWQAGESHIFYVHGRDTQGNWGFFDSTTVYVIEFIDTIPPWVGLTSPDSGEVDIPLNTWIYVTFTEPVDPTTVTSDKILIEGDIVGNYDFWMSYNSMDSTLSINPYDDFAAYESVDVYIASGIQDLAGNPMTSSYWWWFRTGAAPDTLSPTVTAIDVTPDTVQPAEFVVLTGTLVDNQEVSNAEYFIDGIGSNGSGYAALPVDSFGVPVVDVFDTVFTDTLMSGTHTLYLHGVDASGNWGEVDSVFFFISSADTIGPNVDTIDVEPDTVWGINYTVLTGTISDDKQVANAEYFVDFIGSNGTGYPVTPVDSFGVPSVNVFDTVFTDTLMFGTHTLYLHGVDASGNWGACDSVQFLRGGQDTTGPVFDVGIEPSPAFIGDSVLITAIPNEVLHLDSAVVCSVTTADNNVHTLTLFLDSTGYVNKLNTVGFAAGVCEVIAAGYDFWTNYGFSTTQFSLSPGGEFLPEEMVYAWPNPARGNTINFHFYVNANADITVDIYNLEGKRVTSLDGRGEGGRTPHQESSNAIVWNVSGIASDVYLFRIYATSDATGETRSVIKKFAIVK